MALEKVPFQRYKLDDEKAKEKGVVLSVRLNDEELKELKEIKRKIQQPKDSTTLKILAEIGAEVIQHELNGKILAIVLKNIDKNKRIGINFVE